MTDEGQHEHTPECFERVREYRRDRAVEFIRVTPESKLEGTLQAARGAADMMQGLFPDLSTEDQAAVLETMAALIGQIMFTPAHELSDILNDTTAAYILGAAHVSDAYELPEPGEQPEIPALPQAPAEAVAEVVAEVVKNTGMYL